jgi:hypothetical protein
MHAFTGDDGQHGMRRAALLLHGLHPADRGWLLDRLPQEQRDGLEPLLLELRALGVAPDGAALLDTSALAASQAVPAGAGRPQAERIAATPPARLAELLRDEPPALLAQLLAIRAWPWREAFMAQLPLHVRTRVEDRLAAQVPAPRRAEALMDALAAALAAAPAAAPQPARGVPAMWRRLAAGVRR